MVLKRTQVQFLVSATLKKNIIKNKFMGAMYRLHENTVLCISNGAKAPKDSGICRDSRANVPGIPRHIKTFKEKSPETNHKTVIKE